MNTPQISKRYLAAIIDGEGSIGIECMAPFSKKDGTPVRKHNYYTPRLTIINTNLKLMECLVKSFGGTFTERKKIDGCKLCYRWHCFGYELEIIIKQIFPYLICKKEQARLVIEFRKTVGKTGWNVSEELLQHRHQLYLKCKSLNKIGS